MLEGRLIREITGNPRLPDHFKPPLGAFIAAVLIPDEPLHLMIAYIIFMRIEGVFSACTLMHMLEVAERARNGRFARQKIPGAVAQHSTTNPALNGR